MNHFSTTKNFLSNFGLRSALIALTTAFVMFAPSAASAHCAAPRAARSRVNPKMLFATQADGQNWEANKEEGRQNNSSIVGLWHVTFTSAGELFLETFDQWHRDGTEFESANAPAVEGNICLGVWKQIGPRTVKLNHIGWNFDANGNSIGTFTIEETDTLGEDGNSYHGTFDFKVFDIDGNLVFEATGTTQATRITVN